jgi:hypothetical protein
MIESNSKYEMGLKLENINELKEKNNVIDRIHTLLYMARFFHRHSLGFLILFLIQLIVSFIWVYFSHFKYIASCTILLLNHLNNPSDDKGFYPELSPRRFILLTKSDAVQKVATEKIMRHENVSFEEANKVLSNDLKLVVGQEGEINISFCNNDSNFCKEMVGLILKKCNDLNRNINQKTSRPSLHLVQSKIIELEKELKSEGYLVDDEYTKAIKNELFDLRQLLISLQNTNKIDEFENYYVLNKLFVYKAQPYNYLSLLIINVIIFIVFSYFYMLYDIFHFRIKSFFRLIAKN